jgi:exodeoxyribonuclease VIII
MIIEKPGIYKNLSNEHYHASKGLSNSSMQYLLPPHCPKMFWYQHLSGKVIRKSTAAFDLGTAVHTLVFEPQEFAKRFYCVQEVPKKNTTIGKAAFKSMEKTAAGRAILDKVDQDTAYWMAGNVTSHSMWKSVKGDASGCIEDSLAWTDPDSGILLRSRPDFYTDDIIIDLKTTKDSSPYAFQKAVSDYAYHRQGALSIDGLTTLKDKPYRNVVLFVVDKNPPHFVRCYVMTDNAIEQGRYEYKYAAAQYRKCSDTGLWESYPEIIEDLDLPQWSYRHFENG